ncbi:MAG: hypothetical protein CVT67_05030 [Actinobacteria bacterium HGW-Actinobacteria-7]|jgi:hypothetical protein|nr:MAG: hypothetical protein CVT67_05030 [Actinobacteria bacterium HGW-Actinobacteria-7]
MRRLTFAGYLKFYVPYLADSDSLALSRLWEQTTSHPRATEPLLLLAAVTGRSDALAAQVSAAPALAAELDLLAELTATGALESSLADADPRLGSEYLKVWRSYVVRRDAHLRDADLKRLARQRVLELEATRHVTRYRMAKDLGLNPGNLHAFLALGNVTKLSLDHAYELVEYLQAA